MIYLIINNVRYIVYMLVFIRFSNNNYYYNIFLYKKVEFLL